VNGCNSHAARALAAMAGVTLAATGASAGTTPGGEGVNTLSPSYSPELNQRMLDLGITDLAQQVSIKEFFPGVVTTAGDTFTQLNPNNDTPNEASSPSVINAADVNAFLGIDCIPDVVATIAPIGSVAPYANYGEPWRPAEGFLAGNTPGSPVGVPTVAGDMLIATAWRGTIFTPANRADDPATAGFFESDYMQDPDYLNNARWTLYYYAESGAEGNDLNSPHLPSVDTLQPISGDNSSELIAKFQFVGPGWFEETCVGFDSNAVPVTGIGVGFGTVCINFTGLGPSCLNVVAIEHDPVMLDHGECYWVEFVPEVIESAPIASQWVLSASAGATVEQDAQSWRDTSNVGFVNGNQGSPDYAMCVNIDVDPNNTGPSGFNPMTSTDAGMNNIDYVASGCTSVVCNTTFGLNDTCGEAIPVANLGGLGANITDNSFCSADQANDPDTIPDPAATPTGDTVGAFGLVAPLWYSVVGTGNDISIDLCFPGTDDDTGVSRSWWIAAYCGTGCGIGQIFPVASANSFDQLNGDCPLVFNNEGTGDFPELVIPTSSGQVYQFAIFSELGDGNIEFQVNDLGTPADPAALNGQCEQCDLDVAVAGGVPAIGTYDLIEAEDELSAASPTGGVCEDGFTFPDALSWREQTRANDFCEGTTEFTQGELDLWNAAFTPLNGAPQTDIFLPNFGGPGVLSGPGSSYNLSGALAPLSLPFSASIRGNLFDEPFGSTVGDFQDNDAYGFTVPSVAIVRFQIAGETNFSNNINTITGKVDAMTGLPDINLGFQCDTLTAQSDGGGGLQCAESLNSTVVYPGEFYVAEVGTSRDRTVDCLSTLGRRYFGSIEIFACPPINQAGATQFESGFCRTDFYEFSGGMPVFEDDPMNPGNPLPRLWPNGNPRFANLINELNDNNPVFDVVQDIDPVTGEGQIDAFGEPVLSPSMGAGQLVTAFFGSLDSNGDQEIDPVSGNPILVERALFERTEFVQSRFQDQNLGCVANVDAQGETLTFDAINLPAIGAPAEQILGFIGEDELSPTQQFDEDWYRFTSITNEVTFNAESFADLYIEIYEDPNIITEIPEIFNECPDMGMGPTPVPVDCDVLFLAGGGLFVTESDCSNSGEFTISDLVPGNAYVIRVQVGEPLLGVGPGQTAGGLAGRGLLCGDDIADAQTAYLLQLTTGGSIACVGDVTTTGATLPGQPGFGVQDGIANLDDLGYYLNFWVAGDLTADFTTTGATLSGQPGFGVADGNVDLDDLGYFLNFWLQGCN
jgi:hypothetical protein